MYNSEKLQEKWKPILEHNGLEDVKDNHRKAVTAILLENQEKQNNQKISDETSQYEICALLS